MASPRGQPTPATGRGPAPPPAGRAPRCRPRHREGACAGQPPCWSRGRGPAPAKGQRVPPDRRGDRYQSADGPPRQGAARITRQPSMSLRAKCEGQAGEAARGPPRRWPDRDSGEPGGQGPGGERKTPPHPRAGPASGIQPKWRRTARERPDETTRAAPERESSEAEGAFRREDANVARPARRAVSENATHGGETCSLLSRPPRDSEAQSDRGRGDRKGRERPGG